MIKLIKSSFHNEIETKKSLAEFILNSEIFSMDKQCENFEKAFAKKQERKYCVFVNSGSSANLLLIQSLLNLGVIKKNAKIGISALTWATNVMPIIQLGLTPILLDCELETLNVPPKIIESAPKMDAFFITNTLGLCDNIEKIKEICIRKKILLIEDNCESLGTKAYGKLLGNFGIASTFSTFVGHHLSTIEGGLICTDDEKLHQMLKMCRAHGWDRNLKTSSKKHLRETHKIDDFFAKYTFYELGYNFRPTEIQGFLGNVQIKYWDKIVEKRQNNFEKYKKAVNKNNELISIKTNHIQTVSNFAMPIISKNKSIFYKYKQRFIKNKVEIRPIIAGNIGNQPFYKKYSEKIEKCPNTDIIEQNGFYIPNNPELNETEIKVICKLLEK